MLASDIGRLGEKDLSGQEASPTVQSKLWFIKARSKIVRTC